MFSWTWRTACLYDITNCTTKPMMRNSAANMGIYLYRISLTSYIFHLTSESNVRSDAHKVQHVQDILVAVHEHHLRIVAQVLLTVEDDAHPTAGKVCQPRGIEYHPLYALVPVCGQLLQ